jgi:tetratricopeptide (TPR) repeat protein
VFILVAIALAACTYITIRRGYADWLYGGTEELSRVQLACKLEPEDPDCALIRAELSENKSYELPAWEQAVRLNPRSAEVLSQAAIIREMNGDVPGAERLLLKAEDYNHLWLPRWSLASFYFRQNRPSDTLKWAKLALNRAFGDRRAAFRLCRQAGASDQVILNDMIASDDPQNLSAFLYWITEEDRLDTLEQGVLRYLNAALHSRRSAEPSSNPAGVLSDVIEMLLQRGRAAEAHDLWKRMLAGHLLTVAAATADEALTNPSFALPAVSAPCFDWRIPQYDGIAITRGTPPDGIHFEFNGGQPEVAELLVQAVDLAGSPSWILDYEYRARNISSERYRLEWILTPWGGSGTIDAESPVKPTISADGWTHESLIWTIPDDARFFRLAFIVRRILGHIRIEGGIQLRNLRLSPLPSSKTATR